MLITLLVIWAAITVALIGSVIYRSIVEIHEDDQLFLDRKAESMLEQEQEETLRRIRSLDVMIKWSGAASGTLLLVIAGIWVYQGIFTPPL